MEGTIVFSVFHMELSLNTLLKEANPGDPEAGLPYSGLGVTARLRDVGDPFAGEPAPPLNLERGAGMSQDTDEGRA